MSLKIALMIFIFFIASLTNAHSFEMFGIDILAATRSQITGAILQHGADKLLSNDRLADRYDANAIFPGARMTVGFTVDEELESIICRFDSGSWFIDVLTVDDLRQILIEKYGKPLVTPAGNRHNDFEEELEWTKGGITIRLVSYKWHAAWRIHVTHQLSYTVDQAETLEFQSPGTKDVVN